MHKIKKLGQCIFFLVSTLKEQLEDMKKISQNSQASTDKIVQLQNQVRKREAHKLVECRFCFYLFIFVDLQLLQPVLRHRVLKL